jgi:hypothetical protein
MSRKRKAEPKTPEEIAADRQRKRELDFDAAGLQSTAAHLDRNADVEVTRSGGDREGRKVLEDSARRLDAFASLKVGMTPGAYDAARRLERDMLTRAGLTDRGRSLIRVDQQGTKDHTDRAIDAARRVEGVAAKLSLRDWWLLSTLVNQEARFASWRDAVQHITGEDNANAQGAAVRAACGNLAEAYEKLDRVAKKAA